MPKVKFLKGCIYANGKHAKAGDILNIEDNEFRSLKNMGKVELFKENEDNKMTDIQEPIVVEANNIDVIAEAGDASEGIDNIDVVSETDDASEATETAENEIVTEAEEAVTDNTKKSSDVKSSKKKNG